MRYVTAPAVNEEALLANERRFTEGDATEHDYNERIERLLFLSEALRTGLSLPPKSANFLAAALRQIANGEDATKALGIQRKRGERDTREATFRAMITAMEVAEHRRSDDAGKRVTVESAIAQVATQRGMEEETVRAYWRDWHRYIELSTHQGTQFVFGGPEKRRRKKKVAK